MGRPISIPNNGLQSKIFKQANILKDGLKAGERFVYSAKIS